jgi:hypothetical protein
MQLVLQNRLLLYWARMLLAAICKKQPSSGREMRSPARAQPGV